MRAIRLAFLTAVLAAPSLAAQEVEDFGFAEYTPAAGSQPDRVVLKGIGDGEEVHWTCTPGGVEVSFHLPPAGPARDARIQVEFDGDGRETLPTRAGDAPGVLVLSGDAAAFSRKAWTSTWLVVFPVPERGEPQPLAFALSHVDEALSRMPCVTPVHDVSGNLSWAKRDTVSTPPAVRAVQRRNMERVTGVSGGADFSGQGSTVEHIAPKRAQPVATRAGVPPRFTNAGDIPGFMRESYPSALRSERATGTTDLELTVNADGEVVETQVLRSSRGMFTQRALRVAEQLRFNRAAEPVRTVRVQLRWHPVRGDAVIVRP